MSPRAGLKYQAKVIKEPKDDSWKLEILDRVLKVNSVTNSVPDPYSFFTDPDPEVEAGDQYG
jgi:hypothetical protein